MRTLRALHASHVQLVFAELINGLDTLIKVLLWTTARQNKSAAGTKSSDVIAK